ncbi:MULTISPECIES: PfkB family carbohydrate kinase [Cellulophaga]|uniref:PfkB domain protein n=2 Tax=Cellulophaga TaxID=104264 RepID=F0RGP8_CELLC|nr:MULTISPECIES: PfkB family carbohydrate kinase [Cellulophaga]ADY29077.1 PfkB domain protein [Cellulophaga lytica DSM 7489]AIM60119.1 sugar kinase [Cellulophaga lytica]APU09984.1 sugar kinase [Cellulophaga lytica]EWH13213.1 PfkB domain-containing protein [Cellulophaga geojensis KL-A]MDO6491288.1 PfkB family carbohydrate kinase [Cellulophaga sp. 2_MG-2023]
MSKLLIVGTVAFDAIETPFGKTDVILGGAATYIALAASQFKVNSAIVSVVGEDFPQEHLDLLKSKNVDLSALEIVKGGKTFYWKGKYHNDLNSRDTLATELNVLADFKPVVPESYKEADVVMLGNLHPSVQMSVIEQMTKKPKLIVLDTMNFWMDNALDELLNVIKHIDVITINDEEARQLTGEYSLVKAAAKIQTMGPKFVVIKKGEHGALLFKDDNVFFAPALPLEEVFDPTGAGDTFAGGFSGYLAASGNVSFDNLKSAIIHGSNLASFCVERFGTERMEKLEKTEVDKRLRQFAELTQFNIELQ